MKRPNLPNGGLRLSHAEDGLSQFDPPRTLPARKSVALGDEVDSRLSGPKDNIMKLHANWGHAPAQQLNGVLVDSDRELMGSINVAEESPQQREVCCAYDKAPDDRSRAPRGRRPSVRSLTRICYFRRTRLLRARWTCTPSTPYRFQRVLQSDSFPQFPPSGGAGCLLQSTDSDFRQAGIQSDGRAGRIGGEIRPDF